MKAVEAINLLKVKIAIFLFAPFMFSSAWALQSEAVSTNIPVLNVEKILAALTASEVLNEQDHNQVISLFQNNKPSSLTVKILYRAQPQRPAMILECQIKDLNARSKALDPQTLQNLAEDVYSCVSP
jgi:hypothetical protein